MSDDEEVYSEEEQEEVVKKPAPARPAKKLEMKGLEHLDEESRDLLENNLIEREGMGAEIRELRERSEIRKKERKEEEKKMAVQRAEEDAARKAQEEDRRKKKDEEENKKREMRQSKMEEFNKLRNATGPNFVISKKEGSESEAVEEEEDTQQVEKKTREQLEHEKQVALQQRIKPLEIDGADMAKLQEKAKFLHKELFRIEGEKFDLEKRFKEQQYDMMELAERARSMIKVGKGGLKRVQMGADEHDRIQDKIAGAPAKIEMYSKYERQKDKRGYQDRHSIFKGATWAVPIEKMAACKKVKWNPDTGLPEYEYLEGYVAPPEEEEE